MNISLNVNKTNDIIRVDFDTNPQELASIPFTEIADEADRRTIISVAHAIEWLKTAARMLNKEFHFYQNGKLLLATGPKKSENTIT